MDEWFKIQARYYWNYVLTLDKTEDELKKKINDKLIFGLEKQDLNFMLIKSYAKINLSLRVLKKLKSGLHDIETNFFVINLFDEIKLKRIRGIKDKIKFKGKFHQFINKNNNSITNTLVTLRKWDSVKLGMR